MQRDFGQTHFCESNIVNSGQPQWKPFHCTGRTRIAEHLNVNDTTCLLKREKKVWINSKALNSEREEKKYKDAGLTAIDVVEHTGHEAHYVYPAVFREDEVFCQKWFPLSEEEGRRIKRSFSKPHMRRNSGTSPSAAEETKQYYACYSTKSVYSFDKCVWSKHQVNVPTDTKNKINSSSLQWEGTNSTQFHSITFPQDLTSDEVGSHAEESAT